MSDETASTLFRDVTLFTPDGRRPGDCLIEDGRIARLGDLEAEADRTVDGEGRWLMPGAIDAHVHFRDPGSPHKEDFATGSSAAVAGGVTTIFDMPNTTPTTTDARQLADKRQRAESTCRCNFGLFYGATTDNAETYADIEGVPGLKIFMGSSTGDLLVSDREDLEEVFAHWEGRICVHAEDQPRLQERKAQYADREDPAIHSVIRDPEAAAKAVRLACDLAIEYGRDLHVLHLSTTAELEVLREARRTVEQEGHAIDLTAEVCPHHLFLNTDIYETLGTRARVNPPIRSEENRQAVWEALRADGIQFVATDHAPHTPEEKDRGYWEAPSGLPGVQTVLPLMLDAADSGLCEPEDVVDWLAHRPAETYGIAERGRLTAGAHADLVLVDPQMTRRVTHDDQFSRCGWTPWEGRELTGWPVLTMVGGQVAYRRDGTGKGEVVAEPGTGTEVDFS